MTVRDDAYQIVQGSGRVIAVATAEATDTVKIGRSYLLTVNTDCYVRFSGSAVAATDGNFDLFMPAGSAAILRATHATLRVIRATADGVLGVSEIQRV